MNVNYYVPQPDFRMRLCIYIVIFYLPGSCHNEVASHIVMFDICIYITGDTHVLMATYLQ